MILRFCILFYFAGINTLCAQRISELAERANHFYNQKFYEEAIPVYREWLIYDNALEAKKNLARSYRITGQAKKARYWYEQVLASNPPEPEFSYEYAQVLQACGAYDSAADWYLRCINWYPEADKLAQNCRHINKYFAHAEDIEISLLPFNTPESDLAPAFSPQGLIFSSSRTGSLKSEQAYENGNLSFLDIYTTDINEDKSYGITQKLKGTINTNFHDGPAILSPDGNKLFFTQNSKGKKQGEGTGAVKILKIFTATKKKNGIWGDIKEFEYASDFYSVGHPSLSADNENIYFISDMDGGFGGTDIYLCYRLDSLWSSPVNLGSAINTPGDEMFPYIHPDGTLYFSSNGHPGIGGFDLFYSNRLNGSWIKPINCNAPINSAADDITIIVEPDKNAGYFSSSREGGAGKEDIYRFTLKNPVVSAAVITSTTQTASYAANPSGIPYEVNSFLNEALRISEVPFEFKKTYITYGAQQQTDKVIELMQRYPLLSISIEAHTDSQGESAGNKELTEVMAANLREYMVSRGITRDRLVAQGFGETFLLNECRDGVSCTEEQHRQNRRIMFRVISTSGIPSKVGVAPPSPAVAPAHTNTVAIENTTITPAETPSNVHKNEGEFIDFNDGEIIEPTPQKVKKPKKERLPKASQNTGFDEEAGAEPLRNDEVSEAPLVFATEDESGLKFAIVAGPYPDDYPKLSIAINKLHIAADFTTTEDGKWYRIGYFTTISESEEVLKYFKKNGFNKVDIIPYADGKSIDLPIKKLKKQGIK